MVIHDQNKVLFSLSLVSVCVCERETMLTLFLKKICSSAEGKPATKKYVCVDVTRLSMEQNPTELLRQRVISLSSEGTK